MHSTILETDVTTKEVKKFTNSVATNSDIPGFNAKL